MPCSDSNVKSVVILVIRNNKICGYNVRTRALRFFITCNSKLIVDIHQFRFVYIYVQVCVRVCLPIYLSAFERCCKCLKMEKNCMHFASIDFSFSSTGSQEKKTIFLWKECEGDDQFAQNPKNIILRIYYLLVI